MLKWFSIRGIIAEIKRIRWSKPKDLAIDSGTVLIFTAAFALFFVLCTAFNAWFINDLLGI
ncbi:preprotein translocase subunit SecE [Breznakia sp. PF5-3]|uniref:preprotein translocase subunit SecE n=1 Tax=unclassified Breznakia TaxID=2623764 RepID=UPI0024060F6B|nr:MULTISPECIES: preprotein translocase subunit SecE [unclassified Breznakia]MDL2276548.1 preprotein translocase subunit SecE [Breznakia sp. OttesenSCG-928-G09]MDF9825547.1 preprotein translocase subunit SecE [Breznakia sp. PM6-1]MDF9836409.1 preprotein translocase subunit SecE [Breznakia sp. PF5-3]MDF9838200.1 preprotein translocase subunit SecE [Breznakia sp. PFB2-8]MDF9860207.1 preprotein translocase subunit SecE [Breznakia sp. PH5-24]